MRVSSPGVLLALVATVVFVLAFLGVTFGKFGELDLVALGLACFAAAHVVR